MSLWISDKTKRQKVQVWTLQFYGQMKRWPPRLCALSGSHWNSGVNSWQQPLKKTLRPKKQNKVWPFFSHWHTEKLKNSRGHTWVPFVTTIHYYVTPYDTLSLRENSFSDKLFISIESQKTSMYIGRYCIPNQSLSQSKTWIQVADNVFVV